MTVVALIVAPLVLLYQGWTYHVFRARRRRRRAAPPTTPRRRRAACARSTRASCAAPGRSRSCSRWTWRSGVGDRAARPRPGGAARRDRGARLRRRVAAARSLRDARAAGRRFARARRARLGVRGRGPARRGRASSRGSAWRSPSTRLRRTRPRSTGPSSGELAASAVQGLEGLEAYFGRYLPQAVLACVVPLAVLVWVGVVDLAPALVMLLTLPLVPGLHVADRPLLAGAGARALAGAARCSRPISSTSSRGLPTLRAYNRGRAQAVAIERGRRPLPAGDDGHAAGRVPLGIGARARLDARRRAGRGHGRRQARRRRDRLPGGADGAPARARAVCAAPAARHAVPRERRRAGGRRAAARPAGRAAGRRRAAGTRRRRARPGRRCGSSSVVFSYPARPGRCSTDST